MRSRTEAEVTVKTTTPRAQARKEFKTGDRISATLDRRIAGTPADTTVRWEKETLSGVVERTWRDLLLVQFEGAREDGSHAGCLVQVKPTAVGRQPSAKSESENESAAKPARNRRG